MIRYKVKDFKFGDLIDFFKKSLYKMLELRTFQRPLCVVVNICK